MSVVRWAAPERHESIGSTNTEALAAARPGRVVVADHQSEGRGRRGRRWDSPPGRGMAISAVVPPVPPGSMGWLPLVAGLALVRALTESRWPVPAALKWPNDVLALLRGPDVSRTPDPSQQPVLTTDDGRAWGKVAGILTQVADAPARAVVVGTGLNVDHALDELPVPTATSWRLARGGAPLPEGARTDLLEHYLHHLADLHGRLAEGGLAGVGAVRTAYLEHCLTVGRPVLVHRPDGGRTRGTAVGVDPHGALVVEGPEGRSVHHAGDVEHVRPG
ncbi:biotin--[acetyl-CoA-carboxylase] ligase [Ornithinimicrobium sp. W1679]|uniref:biotin--[acetyl-CoA-carboxylase] ligase n=1 Tax=Ornithinimicrobium sp. W1679 TaxID=3418770 RepID=UPI003CFB771D